MAGTSGLTQFAEATTLDVSRIRFASGTAARTRGVASYLFLLAFIFLLYLNVPIVFPALEVIHPAKLVSAGALLALALEIMSGRAAFDGVGPRADCSLVSCVPRRFPASRHYGPDTRLPRSPIW